MQNQKWVYVARRRFCVLPWHNIYPLFNIPTFCAETGAEIRAGTGWKLRKFVPCRGTILSRRPGWEKFVPPAWFGTICPAGLAGNSFSRRPGLGQFVPRTWLGPICSACLVWDHLSRKPGLGRFVLQAWFRTTRPANLVWNNFVPQAWLQSNLSRNPGFKQIVLRPRHMLGVVLAARFCFSYVAKNLLDSAVTRECV